MNSKIGILESNLQQFQAKSVGQSNAINDLKDKREQLTKGTSLITQKKMITTINWQKSKLNSLWIMRAWE
jgi:hypothetical protein